jgi:hypothetical protein
LVASAERSPIRTRGEPGAATTLRQHALDHRSTGHRRAHLAEREEEAITSLVNFLAPVPRGKAAQCLIEPPNQIAPRFVPDHRNQCRGTRDLRKHERPPLPFHHGSRAINRGPRPPERRLRLLHLASEPQRCRHHRP